MTFKQKKKLLKAQQGELDAVILYKKLASIVENENSKNKLLKIASDEGKHASILKEYTKEILKPKPVKAYFVFLLYKVLGHNYVCTMLEKGELKSIEKYKSLVEDFPNIQIIIKDEKIHSEIVKGIKI